MDDAARTARVAQLKAIGLAEDQIDAAIASLEASAKRPGHYWNHKSDPEFSVIGEVTDVWEKPGYRAGSIDPGVAIKHPGIPGISEDEDADGNHLLLVSTGLTAWKNAANRERPAVGDTVLFETRGYPTGKKYFDLSFKVLIAGPNRVDPTTGGEKAPF